MKKTFVELLYRRSTKQEEAYMRWFTDVTPYVGERQLFYLSADRKEQAVQELIGGRAIGGANVVLALRKVLE